MQNPLAEFREARGLSLADAQLLLGVHYTALCRVEGGYSKPGRALLGRLADLGVPAAEFMAKWEAFALAKRAAVLRRVNGNAEVRA